MASFFLETGQNLVQPSLHLVKTVLQIWRDGITCCKLSNCVSLCAIKAHEPFWSLKTPHERKGTKKIVMVSGCIIWFALLVLILDQGSSFRCGQENNPKEAEMDFFLSGKSAQIHDVSQQGIIVLLQHSLVICALPNIFPLCLGLDFLRQTTLHNLLSIGSYSWLKREFLGKSWLFQGWLQKTSRLGLSHWCHPFQYDWNPQEVRNSRRQFSNCAPVNATHDMCLAQSLPKTWSQHWV